MFPILFAEVSQYVFGILMFVTSLFLILLVLVQRGRGGGLAGALGGMGGQSAFGTKAGGHVHQGDGHCGDVLDSALLGFGLGTGTTIQQTWSDRRRRGDTVANCGAFRRNGDPTRRFE